MKTITEYQCEVCGARYPVEAAARECESRVLPPPPVKIGDKVKVYERYDGPTDDEIVALHVRPSFAVQSLRSWFAAYGEEGYGKMLAQAPNITFHTWGVEVKREHMMSKDGDYTNEVSLANIYVDGNYLPDMTA